MALVRRCMPLGGLGNCGVRRNGNTEALGSTGHSCGLKQGRRLAAVPWTDVVCGGMLKVQLVSLGFSHGIDQ